MKPETLPLLALLVTLGIIGLSFASARTPSPPPAPPPPASECVAHLINTNRAADYSYIDKDTPGTVCGKAVCTGTYAECTATNTTARNPFVEDMVLVFSDEFNDSTRNFGPGKDRKWHAIDLHYLVNGDAAGFRSDAVTVKKGSAVIRVTREATSVPVSGKEGEFTHTVDYKAGMMQGWNKFCFTGGYLEARVKLPGGVKFGGLWPAIFTMGNLGRAGYVRSTESLWPYSYNVCDSNVGVVPWSELPGQAINACSDSSNTTRSNKKKGRGAPEIDLFEIGIWEPGKPEMSTSLQMAPLLPPNTHWLTLEGGMYFPTADTPLQSKPNPWEGVNSFEGSPRPGNSLSDAMSAIHMLNESHFESYHKYGFDWAPGEYIRWYLDDQMIFEINKKALAAVSNAKNETVGPRMIPHEPSYIIMNIAMSNTFAPIDPLLPLPAQMEVDYVRVYQRPGSINIGCDPPDYPTGDWISCHIDRYKLATWDDHVEVRRCSTDPDDMLLGLVIPLAVVGLAACVIGFCCMVCQADCCTSRKRVYELPSKDGGDTEKGNKGKGGADARFVNLKATAAAAAAQGQSSQAQPAHAGAGGATNAQQRKKRVAISDPPSSSTATAADVAEQPAHAGYGAGYTPPAQQEVLPAQNGASFSQQVELSNVDRQFVQVLMDAQAGGNTRR